MNTFKNLKSLFFFAFLSIFALSSCGDDANEVVISTSSLTLNIAGLEDLGNDYAYEGWIIVDGTPVTAGIFNVDANGGLTQQTFELDAEDLSKATAYVLTIEPSPDNDPAPSKVHILGGEFSGNAANLVVDHPMAIGTDFLDSEGRYVLATPTDGSLTTNLHHKVERYKGGKDTLDNLVMLHPNCHHQVHYWHIQFDGDVPRRTFEQT